MMTGFAVVLGLVLGSFLSVLLSRWGTGESVIVGRSRCPHCKHTLAFYDLVPLASWAASRGRCRYCRAPISLLYPILELIVAAVFGVFAYRFGISGATSVELIILFCLLALFFFDLRYGVLPDTLLMVLAACAGIALAVRGTEAFPSALLVGAAVALVFGGLHLFSRGRWIGLGDVKLGMALGIVLGYPATIPVTVIAIWTGAAIGLTLIVLRRATLQTALPFGAVWIAIALVALLWPEPIRALNMLIALQ